VSLVRLVEGLVAPLAQLAETPRKPLGGWPIWR